MFLKGRVLAVKQKVFPMQRVPDDIIFAYFIAPLSYGKGILNIQLILQLG